MFENINLPTGHGELNIDQSINLLFHKITYGEYMPINIATKTSRINCYWLKTRKGGH